MSYILEIKKPYRNNHDYLKHRKRFHEYYLRRKAERLLIKPRPIPWEERAREYLKEGV